jgi:hypothetical protein
VERWNLSRASPGDQGAVYQDAVDPISARVAQRHVLLSAFPGVTEVVVRRRSGLSQSLGVHLVPQGSASLSLPEDWSPAEIDSLQVVRFTPRPLPVAW